MKKRINDEERRLWVLNDASLYADFERSKHTSVMEYVKAHRQEIDAVIRRNQ